MSIAGKEVVEFETGDLPFLQLKAWTWYKETHGMFDYHEPPEDSQILNAVHAFHIYRKEAEDKCYISTKLSKVDTLLLQVVYKDGFFHIGTNPGKNHYYENAVWRVLKDYPIKKKLVLLDILLNFKEQTFRV